MSRSRICSTRKAGLRRPLRTAIWATAPRLLAGSSQTVLVANSAAVRAWSPAGSRAGSRSLGLAVTMAPAPSATRRRRALRRGPGGGRCLRGPPSPRSRRRRRPGVAVRGDAPSGSGPPRRRCLAARASPSRDTRAPRGSPRSRLGDRGPRPRARGGSLAAGSARGRCFGEAPWTPTHLSADLPAASSHRDGVPSFTQGGQDSLDVLFVVDIDGAVVERPVLLGPTLLSVGEDVSEQHAPVSAGPLIRRCDRS